MRTWLGVFLLAAVGGAEALADADPVEWKWQRVRPWEYVAGPVLVGGSLVVRFAGPQPDRNWQGGILFDQAVTDAVAIRGTGRPVVATISDVGFYSAMGFRLIDGALLPGLIHGNWDVSLQVSFIDLESFGIVAAVLWGSHLAIGRERPYMTTCRADPEFAARESDCTPSDDTNRSFIAGHPAVGVTAAALTCLHHSHMPLYGRVGDGFACWLTIVAAAANGAGRVLAEKHYTSDLILGVSLGIFAGYIVPKTLHYGWGDATEKPRPTASRGAGAVVLPSVTSGGLGLALLGWW
jgi:membrane-associated phospholipid phosphatase